MPESTVARRLREFRARILAQDELQMREMTRRWLEVERAITAQMEALAEEIAKLIAAGEDVSRNRIYRLQRYRELLADARKEIRKFNTRADNTITRRQSEYVRAGIEDAIEALDVQYREAGATATFGKLHTAAVEDMIGRTSADTPLAALLRETWPDAAAGMTQALIDGIALGYSPRKTARKMADGLGVGLNRALTIARTEQLKAYREASRQQYQASGVVVAYRRMCARNGRTCLACLLLDGTTYQLESEFADHPNGRCTIIPIVIGLSPVEWPSGKDWFLEQPVATQQSIMGKSRYQAWRNGEVALEQMARHTHDPVWGPSVVVVSLKELRGGNDQLPD